MGFSRQKYWSGLPCSPPGGRPNPGIKPLSHVSYIHRHGLFTTRKNLPAMQETQVQLLGQEDPLEKEMASHSSTLAWRIPWTEEPGGLQTMGWQRVRRHFTFTFNGASQVAQWQRICLPSRKHRFDPWVRKIPWRKKW